MTVPTATTAELLEQTAALCDDPAIHAYGVTVEAVTRLNRLLDRRLREGCGITIAWFEALLRIGRSGGFMTMGELATQLALTNGGVTRMVDKMAEAGLVAREACETDRRVSYAALTPLGVEVWSRATRMHLDDLREVFTDGLSPAERQVVTDVMDRIRRARPHS